MQQYASNDREKAHQLLSSPESYPGLLSRRECDRKFLIWHYPSVEPSSSWSLFRESNKYWVRRIEWDKSLQFPSYDTTPYTYGCEVSIPTEQAEELLISLAQIEFRPFVQPELVGLDGTICGIQSGNHWLSCRVTWWYVPSDNWQPLLAWFEKAIDLFEAILPISTSRSK